MYNGGPGSGVGTISASVLTRLFSGVTWPFPVRSSVVMMVMVMMMVVVVVVVMMMMMMMMMMVART